MGKRTHIEDYEEQVEDALKHTHVKEFTFWEKVANTLAKYPELMEGFNEFIERYERVVGFLAKWDEEQDKDQDEASPQRINLEQVVTFVKKVKVAICLNDHPDLLEDFTKYLPESSFPMLKLYLHELTIFFSSL
uniref:Uncharacterized protein n=1 Tax=Solanum lycopersicum TaxID=4081 RepID=A0A3Q7IXG4_SOLLC